MDIEAIEEERLLERAELPQPDTVPEDLTFWVERTGWSRLFQGKPLAVIQHTALQPILRKKGTSARSFLEPWDHCYSSATDEMKLVRLMQIVDTMIERCEKTLETTDHTMRCWWHSYTLAQFHAVPFRKTLRSKSRAKYVGHWKQFLCYVFRMWRLEPYKRSDLCGLRLHGKERRQMDVLWELLTRPRQSEIPVLAERVFELSVTFLTDVYQLGRATDLALVHFLAVIGIAGNGTSYGSAYLYTPRLAGTIWASRLLLLEYALPARPYTVFELPERNSYSNQITRMNEIREQYLMVGGFYPIGQMISHMRYGRKIAQVEGGRSLIAWSEDGKQLECSGEFVSMSDFRGFSHMVLQKTQAQMSELMFAWQPEQDLTGIRDDMRNGQEGYSFVSHPDNGLQRCYGLLLRRSWSSDVQRPLQRNGQWQAAACEDYLDREQAFLKDLMLLMHLAGGQPARGPELCTIRCQNSRTTMRNVFILHGQMMFTIKYHKARRSTNHAFFVVLPYSRRNYGWQSATTQRYGAS